MFLRTLIKAYLNAAETALELSAEADRKGDTAAAYRYVQESRMFSNKAERVRNQ